MDGRTPVVLEHPLQHIPSIQKKTIQYNDKPEPDGWVVGFTNLKTMLVVNINRREVAGRWLGGCP